ncbi:hypothetical protein LPJ75_006599, partial [Coemansia sp. RSA 2598]
VASAKVAACWVLATAALLGTVSATEASEHNYKRAAQSDVAGISPVQLPPLSSPKTVQRHPRQLLSDIIDLFNPSREGRAEGDSTEDTPTDNAVETSTENSQSSTETTPSSSSSPTSRTSPTSETERETSSSGRDTETSDSSRTSEKSTTEESNTSRTSRTSRTSSTDEETSTSTSNTRTSPTTTKSSSLVIVTITREGSTRTTYKPPPPTIDQANGEKADVGTSENLPAIIAASVATGVALILAAILYYLHRKRKSRIRHEDDDAFFKSTPEPKPYAPPNKVTGNSPFDLRTHGNDGYNTGPDFDGDHRGGDGYIPAQQ